MLPCPPLSNCHEVVAAIDGELEYQNSLIDTDRAGHTDHGVAGQLVTLSSYVDRAREAWVNHGDAEGDNLALDNLRKCAGICVRALILYGCPRRPGSQAIPAGA